MKWQRIRRDLACIEKNGNIDNEIRHPIPYEMLIERTSHTQTIQHHITKSIPDHSFWYFVK